MKFIPNKFIDYYDSPDEMIVCIPPNKIHLPMLDFWIIAKVKRAEWNNKFNIQKTFHTHHIILSKDEAEFQAKKICRQQNIDLPIYILYNFDGDIADMKFLKVL